MVTVCAFMWHKLHLKLIGHGRVDYVTARKGLREFLRLCRLKCSDFNPVSKPPPIGKFPQARCIREDNLKGLSYSERDTCKSLSRDDHAAAAAVALVEALIGQVGI